MQFQKNCHQFHVQFQKTVTSFMQFQKTVTSLMCSFKKLSPVSCSLTKLSPVSCAVSKKTVTFVSSGGETIRHFAKKNTITRCEFESLQKNFFSSCKMLKLLPFYFFWQIFGNFFFCSNFFSKLQFWINFLCIIFFRFFQM